MTDQDYTDFFEERAAIYEYLGGLSRDEAERRARQDVERVRKEQSA